jgi:hypothetical protein
MAGLMIGRAHIRAQDQEFGLGLGLRDWAKNPVLSLAVITINTNTVFLSSSDIWHLIGELKRSHTIALPPLTARGQSRLIERFIW